MLKRDFKTAHMSIQKTFGEINDLVSFKGISMIDFAYPNHDGVMDADAVSDLMLLREDTCLLLGACDMLIKKITCAIGDED